MFLIHSQMILIFFGIQMMKFSWDYCYYHDVTLLSALDAGRDTLRPVDHWYMCCFGQYDCSDDFTQGFEFPDFAVGDYEKYLTKKNLFHY